MNSAYYSHYYKSSPLEAVLRRNVAHDFTSCYKIPYYYYYYYY